MEFANENVYLTQDRINLKNIKSPFASSKKSNKKALCDVKNIIHQKSIKPESSSWNSSHLTVDSSCLDSVSKDLKSPKQRKKSTYTSKEAVLHKMDEEFFICTSCFSQTQDDNVFDILPDNLRLSKDEIDIFATRWSNAPSQLDISANPIQFEKDFFDEMDFNLCDISVESSSFLDMLNESYDMVPQLPPISSEELMT